MSDKVNYITPFFDVFSRTSRSINFILVALSLIIGVTYFHLYNWHFGNLKFAIEREKGNLTGRVELIKTIQETDNTYEINALEMIAYNLSSDDRAINNIQVDGKLSEGEIEKIITTKIGALNAIVGETLVAETPLIGIRVVVTDYIFFILFIGGILISWLFAKLNQLQFSLSTYLNDFRVDSSIDNSISPLFYSVAPEGKFYKFIELLLWLYIISLCVLIASNTIEIFSTNHSYGLSLNQQEGWDEFLPHVIVTYGLSVVGVIVAFWIYKLCAKKLQDIRNVLFILKWIEAFTSALYTVFSDRKAPLVQGGNFIEYRKYGNSKESSLVVSIQRVGESNIDTLHSVVQLHENYILYQEQFQSDQLENTEIKYDRVIGRRLTREEEKAKSFFIRLLTDDSNENKIAEKFYVIARKAETEQIVSNVDKVRELIKDGKIELALSGTSGIARELGLNELLDTIILLNSRLKHSMDELDKGRMSMEGHIIEQTKVTTSLLKLLKELE